MKFETKKLTKWIGALAISALAPLANAALFTNGTFDAGYSPWTPIASASPACAFGDHLTGPRSGAGSAFLECESGGTATLSQSFDPNPSGLGFDVEFWLANSISDQYSVPGFSIVQDNPLLDFDKYSGHIPGGLLSFSFSFPTAGLVFLDDVIVVASVSNNMPEPGTLLLVGAALTAGAVARRRKQV